MCTKSTPDGPTMSVNRMGLLCSPPFERLGKDAVEAARSRAPGVGLASPVKPGCSGARLVEDETGSRGADRDPQPIDHGPNPTGRRKSTTLKDDRRPGASSRQTSVMVTPRAKRILS